VQPCLFYWIDDFAIFTTGTIKSKQKTSSQNTNLKNVRHTDNKSQLYWLAVELPFGKECKDCPLKEISALKDFEKQVEMIDNMPLDKTDELIWFHYMQNKQRENEIRLKSSGNSNLF